MAANIRALRERDPHSLALKRYYRIVAILTDNPLSTRFATAFPKTYFTSIVTSQRCYFSR